MCTHAGPPRSADRQLSVPHQPSCVGAAQAQRPLQDPNIFGNYEVAYVSMGKGQYG